MQELDEAKDQCSLPDLITHLRMKKYIKRLTNSPFRKDQDPSWGVYRSPSGDYRWKDLATGDGGDQVVFLARFLHIDEKQNFRDLVAIFSAIASELNIDGEDSDKPDDFAEEIEQPRVLPDKSPFTLGTPNQIQRLSQLRSISAKGLQWAQERGVLIFGNWNSFEVFGVTDKPGEIVEIRRLNGEEFPAFGTLKTRKSHALKHSDKSWPVGIVEAEPYPAVALVEGLPDFLAAHDFILREQAAGGDKSKIRCAPVGLLSAHVKISEEALPSFLGKVVRIFSHADEAGLNGAARWQEQLRDAGAKHVSLFDLTAVGQVIGDEVNDLNELLKLIETEPLKNPTGLHVIMPRL